MANKLFITNKFFGNGFAKHAIFKYSSEYFQKNGWVTKYFTENWDEDLENYDIIMIWYMQQVIDQRKFRKSVLMKLLKLQPKYKYRIFDYTEDIHRLKDFFQIDLRDYKEKFSKKTKNFIILRYDTPAQKYFSNCNYYVIPFSIEPSIIPRFNENPKKSILITGCVIQRVYPKRHIIYRLRNKYPMDVLVHPGWENKMKHDYFGKKYFDKINEYIASPCCCGSVNYNYLVAKYFEIPSTGCLLIAYVGPIKKELEALGFKDMENMISFDDSNVREKLDFITNQDNKDEIDRIRLNGYKLIKDRHTHQTRFDFEFDQFVSELIKK